MDILLKEAKVNKSKLKRLITQLTAGELSKLSEPCYYSPLKGPYFQLLAACGLTEKQVKEFIKRFYKDHPARKWKTQTVVPTNLLLFIMYYFLKERDQSGYSMTLTYLLTRYYSNLMNKHIKYCNPNVFRYTLEHLTRTHLFIREKTIANGLYYLSKQIQLRWTKYIRDCTEVNSIVRFIGEARHRVAQSVRSFAQNYYKASKEGGSIKTQLEPTEDDDSMFQYKVLEKGKRAIEEVTKKICVYKFVDKRAIEDAKKLTKIRSSIAVLISNSIIDLKYSEDIKMILHLFIKDLDNVNSLCGSGFVKYVRRLMAIKRTKSSVYFKQQINLLLEKVLNDIKYKKWYSGLTNQTRFIVNSYFAFYLTMVLKNNIC